MLAKDLAYILPRKRRMSQKNNGSKVILFTLKFLKIISNNYNIKINK